MIKANELRRGNKVKQSFATLTVVEIREKDALCTDFNRTHPCTYPNLKGIPLSPEILESCGFVKHNDGDYHLVWVIHIKFSALYESISLITFHDDELELKLPDIKYLHQLQNLYHALTGHELEIKLPVPLPHVPPSDIHP